ncbi:hypothetical protein ACIA8O_36390 [Kitasatospora sp. NPDC051853]
MLLRPGAVVVFVPDRLVPDLLPYMAPAAESAVAPPAIVRAGGC